MLEYDCLVGGETMYQVVMSIFAHQSSFNALRSGRLVQPDSGDVNEQTSIRVNPPRIDDVELIFRTADGVVWIDFQEVASSTINLRKRKMELGHVVVLGQKGDCRFRYLDINVGVPRHDLLIPPPAEQCSMHYPRLRSDVCHSRQE